MSAREILEVQYIVVEIEQYQQEWLQHSHRMNMSRWLMLGRVLPCVSDCGRTGLDFSGSLLGGWPWIILEPSCPLSALPSLPYVMHGHWRNCMLGLGYVSSPTPRSYW
jgi:hypothetical protein